MCDTFVVLPERTADGSVIFGKNSDREPNEAQVLEYHPGKRHPRGSRVRCTYMEIPQAAETLSVLLSRPFWMWGAEMGANERGVVIGNEAVFTRMPYEKAGRLLGMDMLRLALERASTAEQAVEVMVGLLADYGQGGGCGYQDRKFVYHNSFLVADPLAAWVLETAGPLWAAKKAGAYYAISNRLTIGGDYDRSHPQLVEIAKKRGRLKKGADFRFDRAWSDRFYSYFSAADKRRGRAMELLAGRPGLDAAAAMSVLRDHGPVEAYHPDGHFLHSRICAHAANPLARHAGQSTGSLVAHLTMENPTCWATGTSAPCLSVFKPIRFEGHVLPDLGAVPDGRFNADALWWRHERLHRNVLRDYAARSALFQESRDELEARLVSRALVTGPGHGEALTEQAFREAEARAIEWLERVRAEPVRTPPGALYDWYWKKQNKSAGMPD